MSSGSGYGNFWLDGHTVSASRWAWEQANGPIPTQQESRHIRCNERLCVNLQHLGIGTRKENMHDKEFHGTVLRGNTNHRAVLTERVILEAADLRRSGLSWRRIGSVLGHNYMTLADAVLHRRGLWSHVDVGEIPSIPSGRRKSDSRWQERGG